MFTLYECIDDAGACSRTHLEPCEAGFRVVVTVGSGEPDREPKEVGTVTMAALEAVMERYGRPLADDVTLDGPSLAVGHGAALRLLRHLARYDVIARDFVVLVRPGREPLAELATTVAGALAFLAARERLTRQFPTTTP